MCGIGFHPHDLDEKGRWFLTFANPGRGELGATTTRFDVENPTIFPEKCWRKLCIPENQLLVLYRGTIKSEIEVKDKYVIFRMQTLPQPFGTSSLIETRVPHEQIAPVLQCALNEVSERIAAGELVPFAANATKE